MRARAASPFPEPFMQYKETQMNTRGFSLVREERLSEVSGTVKLWRHDATGAELLSIVNNDENKCFGATFRTPPKDSTGVAHILEHSVLCGSEKYPVKRTLRRTAQGVAPDLPQRLHLPGQDLLPGRQRQPSGFLQPRRRLPRRPCSSPHRRELLPAGRLAHRSRQPGGPAPLQRRGLQRNEGRVLLAGFRGWRSTRSSPCSRT